VNDTQPKTFEIWAFNITNPDEVWLGKPANLTEVCSCFREKLKVVNVTKASPHDALDWAPSVPSEHVSLQCDVGIRQQHGCKHREVSSTSRFRKLSVFVSLCARACVVCRYFDWVTYQPLGDTSSLSLQVSVCPRCVFLACPSVTVDWLEHYNDQHAVAWHGRPGCGRRVLLLDAEQFVRLPVFIHHTVHQRHCVGIQRFRFGLFWPSIPRYLAPIVACS
jgi:hypothetical protein